MQRPKDVPECIKPGQWEHLQGLKLRGGSGMHGRRMAWMLMESGGRGKTLGRESWAEATMIAMAR